MKQDGDTERCRDNNSRILVTGACVQGELHAKGGQPCQDALFWCPIPGGVVAAVADGLSSASHAETGARLAVETVCQVTGTIYETGAEHEHTSVIRDAVAQARQKILDEAGRAGVRPGAYASTLLVAVWRRGDLIIGHIGDGIAAGLQNQTPRIISEPGTSEYANETASLMQDDWHDQLRITTASHIEWLVLATDGCQGALAIRKNRMYIPYEPFLLPLIAFVRKKMAADGDTTPDITGLLTSSRMQELSGDDKTLLILISQSMVRDGI